MNEMMCGQTPEQERQISREMFQLDQQTTMICDRINLLATKLNPILSLRLAEQNDQKNPTPVLCQLADQMYQINQRLRLSIDALENINGSIEL